MNIGQFKNANGQLIGSIATATIDLARLGLRPVESTNERAPAFEIVTLNVARRWVQIGALWELTSNSTGEVFYQGITPTRRPVTSACGAAKARPQLVSPALSGRRPLPRS